MMKHNLVEVSSMQNNYKFTLEEKKSCAHFLSYAKDIVTCLLNIVHVCLQNEIVKHSLNFNGCMKSMKLFG